LKPKLTATEDSLDSPISDCEIEDEIKQFKNGKSPTADQTHAEFLSNAGKEKRISIRM
jgi:hypothetical protein